MSREPVAGLVGISLLQVRGTRLDVVGHFDVGAAADFDHVAQSTGVDQVLCEPVASAAVIQVHDALFDDLVLLVDGLDHIVQVLGLRRHFALTPIHVDARGLLQSGGGVQDGRTQSGGGRFDGKLRHFGGYS